MYNTKIVFIFTLLIFFIFGFSTKNRYIFETSDKVELAENRIIIITTKVSWCIENQDKFNKKTGVTL